MIVPQMFNASTIKLFLVSLLLTSPAVAEPKKEPLPDSIAIAKSSPFAITSFDQTAINNLQSNLQIPSNDQDKLPPPASLNTDNKKNEVKKIANDPYVKTSLDAPKPPVPAAAVNNTATPSPVAPTNPVPAINNNAVNNNIGKGKYIKIPAPTVDLTPPPATVPAPNTATTSETKPKTAVDPAQAAEAESVISDLEDLSLTPPPPPKRDTKTGDVILPNKSRTVVIEKDSILLDQTALNEILEGQNRDYLINHANTMGKSLRDNLFLLSKTYNFVVLDTTTKPVENVTEEPKKNKKDGTKKLKQKNIQKNVKI